MILAKKLKWLVSRWIAFMNESADALLPCCHCRWPKEAATILRA
jgi:hypothetical protein